MAFQGSLKELPLPDIIQLVAVGGKTGVFQLRNGPDTGQIFLRKGQIVHAIAGPLTGEEAIYELAIWRQGEFVFTPGQEAETVSIERSNTNLLMEAARRIDEWQVLSKKIPSTRLVPVFTVEGARTSVSLTPQEWSLICRIDERRSIDEIAIGLGSSAFDVCKVLYGLVTSGLVTLREDLHRFQSDALQRRSGEDLGRLVDGILHRAQEMLAGSERQGEIEAAARQARVGMASGRPVDALLDLVRAGEKLISAVLGPNQARSFLDHVDRLVDGS
ncbi:MAG: DUF4388 domain-containing protein [Acidobacteria bacterium]|nr:DUF4388 domain-containing protein [Thermoanaerobaculia bacterium]MDI9631038.1 DUF4388 domain-containing protein [Acidobacteriota bacterium]OQC42557.1 MAG: hypothetical protein BWX64_00064 [Acidobacteria bacterium ADurb.Bin051]MBP7813459.1 DUF4388 domain-containing protein [Thermoanaerobaculia bacterium]MBP8845903.1 DUF4388 domain-containing protein [Thermoanaerobaculia bacterium]